MKEITLKLYSINELSEESKQKAIEIYRENNTEVFWANETLDSLKGLFNACNGIKLKDYSLGEYNSSLKIEFSQDEVEDLTGKRAFAWLENNLLSYLRIPFHSLSDKDSKRRKLSQYGRYYRAGMIKPCPLTGYCADEDFLDSLKKDIKSGMTLGDSFRGLADEYQKIINNEIEHQNSDEYIIEHMEANEYEFLENGKRY